MPLKNTQNQKGFVEILLVLGIAAFSLFLIGGLGTLNSNISPTDNSVYNVDENALSTDGNSNQNLQLKTFTGTKTTPPPPPPPSQAPIPSSIPEFTPGPTSTPLPNVCPGTSDPLPVTNSCTCPQSLSDAVGCPLGSSACSDKTTPPDWSSVAFNGVQSDRCWWIKYNHGLGSVNPGFTKYLGTSGCLEECVGKPVIYLYPTVTTKVNVKLTIPGYVYISDPIYPVETGWQNVEAHPDGTLIYQGNKYKELYYETAVTKKTVPETGLFIERSKVKEELSFILFKLGLNDREKKEFFEYWLPKLSETKSKYILFSVLTKAQKEEIDSVDIYPKPDTFIDFLVYFKPVDKKFNINPISIPDAPPQRIGFTAVEWGGTLDE